MRAEDREGEAQELFEGWRGFGYSEAEALDLVARSGVVREPEMYERFRTLGLKPRAASVAALGRYPEPPASPRARMVVSFRNAGLSERAAQTAADGRDGPSSLRPASEAGRSSWRHDPHRVGQQTACAWYDDVKEVREWWGRVLGPDGRQGWIRAVDLRRAKSH
jgi:hypothetical protein